MDHQSLPCSFNPSDTTPPPPLSGTTTPLDSKAATDSSDNNTKITPTTPEFSIFSSSSIPNTVLTPSANNMNLNSSVQVSPRRLRNFKNLQLDLSLSPNRGIVKPISLNTSSNEDERDSMGNNNTCNKPFPIPMPVPSASSTSSNGTSSIPMSTSSTSSSLFRSPSLSLKSMKTSPNPNSKEVSLKRRNTTQLALSIPVQPEIKTDTNHDNDISHFQRSSSISRREPIPQTIIHSNVANKNSDNQTEVLSYNPNLKSYPNGPICVLEPNLFLYSEPTLDILRQFDVVFNVAQELTDYTQELSQTDPNIEYYFVPWTHTSKLSNDFPEITKILDDVINNKNKKVLIHCQCGVSRSASLIIAYYMRYFKIGYNEAYHLLKSKAPLICPNLTLIFDLMEWGQKLGYNSIPQSPSIAVVTPSIGTNNDRADLNNVNSMEITSSLTTNPNTSASNTPSTSILVSPTEAATPV